MDGYESVIPPQPELDKMAARNLRVLGAADCPVGTAVLVKSSRLELKPTVPAGAATRKKGKSGHGGDDTRSIVVKIARRRAAGDAPPADIAVCCVHLDAVSEEQRCRQLQGVVKRARMLVDVGDVIVAGDFNTECASGSAVARFVAPGTSDLSDGPSREQMIAEWRTDKRVERDPNPDEEVAWQSLHDSVVRL